MRYSVMVKRGPFESREEAAAYAEIVTEHDPDTVQSVGIIPTSPVYDKYKQPSERREHGAWWLK